MSRPVFDPHRAPIPKFHFNIFHGAMGISTLGTGITFQVIIQQIESDLNRSPYHTFTRKTARNFLAIAWLLFVISLGIASLAAISLAFTEDRHKYDYSWAVSDKRKYERMSSIASAVLLFTMLPAFTFCSLAVTSYCEGAGWAGVAITGVFLVLFFCLWLFHLISRKRIRPLSHFHYPPQTEQLPQHQLQRQSTGSQIPELYLSMEDNPPDSFNPRRHGHYDISRYPRFVETPSQAFVRPQA